MTLGPALEIRDICQTIWQAERKLDLLDFRIEGIPVWQFSRMNLYYELAQRTGVLADPSPQAPDSAWGKVRRYADAFLFKNPLFDLEESEILVIDHSRKVKVDDEYIDVYTKYLLDELRADGIPHTVYEWPEFNRHMATPAANRRQLDVFQLFFRRYERLIPARITREDLHTLAAARQELRETLNVDLDLEPYMRRQLRHFKAKYWLFRRLLERKRPKRIYVVVAYFHGHLIKAAKDLGIEVVELQHGTFSEYHLGYSFPGGEKKLELWPDQFWVWKEFWKDMCRLPFDDEDVKIYPFRHMETEIRRYGHIARKPRQITVVSQGAIGGRIAAEILRHVESLKGYSIFYKLHPSESKTWRNYAALVELSRRSNVRIVEGGEPPLYQLLAETGIVIGVFSTVIYEALQVGCAVYLLRLPGVEYMSKLIEAGHVRYFEDHVSMFARSLPETIEA